MYLYEAQALEFIFLLKFIKVVVVSVAELSSLIIKLQLSSPAALPLG